MNIIIFISEQALERLKKDKYIKNNKKEYNNEIIRIRDSLLNRPKEVIGKFLISPRGEKNIRVAWHIEYNKSKDTTIIYIDDLLYHIKEGIYIDKWNEKARKNLISLNSYSGYSPWAVF